MLFTAQTAFKFNIELEYKNHNCKGNSNPFSQQMPLGPKKLQVFNPRIQEHSNPFLSDRTWSLTKLGLVYTS